MKKGLLYSLLIIFFFCSCKKDHKNVTAPDQKTYKVNFNVLDSGQTIGNSIKNKVQVNSLQVSSIGIAGYLDQLYYYVFDSNSNRLHFISQDSTATNFGSISDNLPAGTYTIVICAGKKGLNAFNTQTGVTPGAQCLFGYLTNLTNDLSTPQWSDTFFDKFQVTVSGDINQSVNLSRMVGQLEVQIQDAIPTTANSISVTMDQEYFDFMGFPTVQLDMPRTLVNTTILPASAKGSPNFITTSMIGNTSTPFKVTINCYDGAQKVLGTAIVDNVVCQKNKRTILSGKLFGSANQVIIGINPWNPTVINMPF